MTSPTSRRAILVGIASVPALGATALAVPADADPIFPLIEEIVRRPTRQTVRLPARAIPPQWIFSMPCRQRCPGCWL
jgi:hypothetical protein